MCDFNLGDTVRDKIAGYEVCAIIGCTELNTFPVEHAHEDGVRVEWERLYAAPSLCAVISDARGEMKWIPICTFHYQGYLVCLKTRSIRGEWWSP